MPWFIRKFDMNVLVAPFTKMVNAQAHRKNKQSVNVSAVVNHRLQAFDYKKRLFITLSYQQLNAKQMTQTSVGLRRQMHRPSFIWSQIYIHRCEIFCKTTNSHAGKNEANASN